MTTIRPSLLIDGKPAAAGFLAEHLGCSTRAVLSEAGLSAAAVDALIESGAAIAPPHR